MAENGRRGCSDDKIHEYNCNGLPKNTIQSIYLLPPVTLRKRLYTVGLGTLFEYLKEDLPDEEYNMIMIRPT